MFMFFIYFIIFMVVLYYATSNYFTMTLVVWMAMFLLVAVGGLFMSSGYPSFFRLVQMSGVFTLFIMPMIFFTLMLTED